MWRSLKHKFVLPFLGIHEIANTTVPQFFLVSPYMKNGTLGRWRKQANPQAAVIEQRVRSPISYFHSMSKSRKILEVAQAMEYIHSECVVHGDLRGENVLLDDGFHVRIADFGLTRLSEATNTRSGALHLNFAAPELFGLSEDDESPSDATPPRTQMSDIYAFGCLYYEIHYNKIPFADEQRLSDGAWDVIQRCWVRDPSKRPIMNKVVESMIAMSQSVSPQINSDDASLREESPSSLTPDTIASQKRKRVQDEPDNHVGSTCGITSLPDRKRRHHLDVGSG
ncbi:kinase-like domain-containing protein [Amanita rubescens]|nr:kinase-like domain-containing protein [Amanita rubescens]